MKLTLIIFLIFLVLPVYSKTLTEVYQKELALLIAQKNSLYVQLKNQNNEYEKKIRKSETQLNNLQKKLVTLISQNEKSEKQLGEVEKQVEAIDNNQDLYKTTISQAKMTLGIESNEIKELFQKAIEKLSESTNIFQTKGEFFLLNGQKTQSDIAHIGSIARYGKIGKGYKALAPVGDGKLKILNDEVINFNTTKTITSFPIFIFESLNKEISEKKEQSFMQMIKAGGAIAYVIAMLGGVAFLLMIARGVLLYKASRFDPKLKEYIQKGVLEKIKEVSQKRETPVKRVVHSTFQVLNRPLEDRENVIQESILGELNFLDKFGSLIQVMAAVAPLLGLLGTVTGMISTFDIITKFGTGDPKLLSSGISEALITTKLGLIVAIPTLLMGNLFSGWSNKIKIMLEKVALQLSNVHELKSVKEGV